MKVVIEVGGHGGYCKLPPVSGAELTKEEIDESESFVLKRTTFWKVKVP